jgi:hypothetical protein
MGELTSADYRNLRGWKQAKTKTRTVVEVE